MATSDIFDELENQRREAYVRAVLRAAGPNDVVGYIGSRVPAALFHAMGLMALPVHGVDGDILEFSTESGLCPVVDATLTYARTDRCPLIHSSRMIVVDSTCPIMAEKMSRIDGKDVYIYNIFESDRDERLISRLKDVYGRAVDDETLKIVNKELDKCDAILRRLKYYSNLSGNKIYILEYYLNFLSLSERLSILQDVSSGAVFSENPVKFVPVRVQSGAGIYRQIDRIMNGKFYRIIEEGCRADGVRYDFVFQSGRRTAQDAYRGLPGDAVCAAVGSCFCWSN